jgi:hypothetical protein
VVEEKKEQEALLQLPYMENPGENQGRVDGKYSGRGLSGLLDS